MTVRLLVQYGKFPPNTNFSGGESVEGMLLRTGQADTNTAAGVTWVDPVPTELSGPTSISSSGGTDLLLADGRELLDLTAARSLVSKDGISAASKIFGVGSGGTAIGAGTTLVTQHPAEFDFVGFQLLYTNQSGAPITVTSAVAYSTAVHQDAADPGTAKKAIAFAGAASGVVPASPGGAASDTRNGYLLADYVPCLNKARTDDATKTPLLQTRSYFAAAANGMSTSAGEIAAWNAGPAAYGRQYAARAPAGDATNTFTASQQPLEAGTWIVPTAVVFYYGAGVKSICVAGDSLSKGHLTTGGATSWPAIVTGMLRQAGKRYAANNLAWTGQTQVASIAVGKDVAAQVKPSYMCFFGWSPNDIALAASNAATTVPALSVALSQATFDDGYARAVEFGGWLQRQGITPVVCTSGAYNALTATQSAMRRANNVRLMALRSLGWIVIDFASVIDNPANTDQINPAWGSPDGLHYPDACQVAMATVAAAAFP